MRRRRAKILPSRSGNFRPSLFNYGPPANGRAGFAATDRVLASITSQGDLGAIPREGCIRDRCAGPCNSQNRCDEEASP